MFVLILSVSVPKRPIKLAHSKVIVIAESPWRFGTATPAGPFRSAGVSASGSTAWSFILHGVNQMKALAFVALAGFSGVALAGEAVAVADGRSQQKVEQYNYSMDLDIARVISRSEVPNVCGVVPVQMVYEDHRGQRHTLEYLVSGSGCSGG